jgi:hypothetical protein
METPTFLYKPNFCAECGEKIDRDSWHFWHSRRFCENCEPVFRMTRIFPVALIVTAVFFGGIFFAQIGQRYERPAPVVSTQAALTAEKPPPVSPKQIFSANQQPEGRNAPINTAPAENSAKTNKALQPDAPAAQESAAVFTCGARTQKGTPCSRRVKAFGVRCWQHTGKPSMLEKSY